MRSMWSGNINWGLVEIPARLYKATEPHQSPFHQSHAADGGRIRYRRICEQCGKDVAWAEIGTIVENGDQNIAITPAELEALPLKTTRAVEVLHFARAGDIDPIFHDETYYMAPGGKSSGKAYALLRDSLAELGMVAVAKVAMRSREKLAMIVPRGGVLALVTLHWADEIRSGDTVEAPEKSATTAKERQLAKKLITAGAAPFEPAAHEDEYFTAVWNMISAKTTPAKKQPARKTADGTPDLGAALQASLDQLAKTKPARKPAAKRPASRTTTPTGTKRTPGKTRKAA